MTGATVVVGGVVGACIVFSSVFVLMRVLAWVLINGLPHMFRLRAQAVVEWQDCDQQGRRTDDEMAVAEAAKLDHFSVWEAELAGEKQIVKHLRRMDRWSR